MRKKIRTALAVAGTMAALVAGAAPATAAPQKAPSECGSYGWFSLYYNHCGSTNVVIWVDQINVGGFRDFEMCVKPGRTEIGPRPQYIDAWYINKLC